jgi:hypothetical protein
LRVQRRQNSNVQLTSFGATTMTPEVLGIDTSAVQRRCCPAVKWLALGVLHMLVLAQAGITDAAIIDVARYQLGEPGTIVSGNPQDSVGGHHFQNVIGSPATITPGALAGTPVKLSLLASSLERDSTQVIRYRAWNVPSQEVTNDTQQGV